MMCCYALMIWYVSGSCPCSSPKKKDLQSGEWSPFGPKTAGFGTGIEWDMEAREDSGPRNGWEFVDNEKMGQQDTQIHISLLFL